VTGVVAIVGVAIVIALIVRERRAGSGSARTGAGSSTTNATSADTSEDRSGSSDDVR